ncbi:MAG: phosphoglycerate mutase family protein [Chloroflexi bacterium]|nr:phosphoglycerate mutase family protein [Chloroflexota bacterium]
MKKEIWLIRHGQSEANAGLKSSDPAAVPLTPKGQEQAKKVSLTIPKTPDQILYSPFIRTQETAKPTLERFPSVAVKEWPIQEFTYLSPALCKDMTALERRPMREKYWERNDPNYIHGEGAESFADLLGRTKDAFDRMKELQSEFVLVFGHGQFMRTLLLSLLLNSFSPTPELMRKLYLFNDVFKIPNCAMIKMTFHDQQAFFSGLITDHLEE